MGMGLLPAQAVCSRNAYLRGKQLPFLHATILKESPSRIFLGAPEDVILLEFSVNLVKRSRSPGAEVSFTIYPFSGHDSWTETYMNDELNSWFLFYSRQ